MNRIDKVKASFLSLPEVKRLKELEHYIDTNPKIKETFALLKDKQKQMVHAKEFKQASQYETYHKEYLAIKDDLFNLPFVEEYFELLEIIDQYLLQFTNEVEFQLKQFINK